MAILMYIIFFPIRVSACGCARQYEHHSTLPHLLPFMYDFMIDFMYDFMKKNSFIIELVYMYFSCLTHEYELPNVSTANW